MVDGEKIAKVMEGKTSYVLFSVSPEEDFFTQAKRIGAPRFNAYNPELFNKLLDVEKSFRRGSFGKRFFLQDIEKQKILEDFLCRR